jgi:hypothetical protein
LAGNFCKLLEIKPGTAIANHDIVIEPATALPVKIQDRDARPLTHTWGTGIDWFEGSWPLEIEKDTCAAYHLEPGKPRLMCFYEPTRKLIGTLVLSGDEKKPAVVTLEKAGILKGRLVGEDGKPLVGVAVNLYFRQGTATRIHDYIHQTKLVETDAEGNFQIDDLVPGQKFTLLFRRGVRTAVVGFDDSVQVGAVLDLGEIKLNLKTEQDS